LTIGAAVRLGVGEQRSAADVRVARRVGRQRRQDPLEDPPLDRLERSSRRRQGAGAAVALGDLELDVGGARHRPRSEKSSDLIAVDAEHLGELIAVVDRRQLLAIADQRRAFGPLRQPLDVARATAHASVAEQPAAPAARVEVAEGIRTATAAGSISAVGERDVAEAVAPQDKTRRGAHPVYRIPHHAPDDVGEGASTVEADGGLEQRQPLARVG
jgi:hypothetical protein